MKMTAFGESSSSFCSIDIGVFCPVLAILAFDAVHPHRGVVGLSSILYDCRQVGHSGPWLRRASQTTIENSCHSARNGIPAEQRRGTFAYVRCLIKDAGGRGADSPERRLETVRRDHGTRRTLARRAAGEYLRIPGTEWRGKTDGDPPDSRIAAAVAWDR